MTNNQEFRQIKTDYGLTHKLISVVTDKSLETVKRWSLYDGSPSSRNITDKDLSKIKQLCHCLDNI